jgi:hypothetical protein
VHRCTAPPCAICAARWSAAARCRLWCGRSESKASAVLCVTAVQVAFVCLLQNIVARSPLIFITLAEVHAPCTPCPAARLSCRPPQLTAPGAGNCGSGGHDPSLQRSAHHKRRQLYFHQSSDVVGDGKERASLGRRLSRDPRHNMQSFSLLNYTTLAPNFRDIPGVAGAGHACSAAFGRELLLTPASAPRWIFPVDVRREHPGGGHSIRDASVPAV